MRVIGAILLLFLLGCGDTAGVGNISSILSQNEISAQRTAWDANLSGSGYTLEVYRSCTCVRPVDFYENYRVTVNAAGASTLIEILDDNGNVGGVLPINPSYYPNLNELFDLMISESFNGNPVFGAFDADESYPTRVDFGVSESYVINVTGYF